MNSSKDSSWVREALVLESGIYRGLAFGLERSRAAIAAHDPEGQHKQPDDEFPARRALSDSE
jgi:hypothetical protein